MDVECPCRQCRCLFQPTLESLSRGSPYWWYCPACQDQQCGVAPPHALRIQLTVALGRAWRTTLNVGSSDDREHQEDP